MMLGDHSSCFIFLSLWQTSIELDKVVDGAWSGEDDGVDVLEVDHLWMKWHLILVGIDSLYFKTQLAESFGNDWKGYVGSWKDDAMSIVEVFKGVDNSIGIIFLTLQNMGGSQ